MTVAFVSSLTAVGAAIFMVDEAHCVDRVDLYSQLDVLEDHLIVMHTARQGDDVEIIIPKAHRDPWLEEFLQAVIHAVDDQRITMNDRFCFRHNLFYNTSPSSRFKN